MGKILLTELSEYINEMDVVKIGPAVYGEDIGDAILTEITAICRRHFKKDEVLVFVDFELDDDYVSGMVFTDEKIFYWKNIGNVIEEVSYKEIDNVDFDESSIQIKYSDKTINIELGENVEEEKYSRYMYNFIMDIVDFVSSKGEK